jgi:hypothetical protein
MRRRVFFMGILRDDVPYGTPGGPPGFRRGPDRRGIGTVLRAVRACHGPAETCPVSARLLRSRRAGGGVASRSGRLLPPWRLHPGHGGSGRARGAVRITGWACSRGAPLGPFKEQGRRVLAGEAVDPCGPRSGGAMAGQGHGLCFHDADTVSLPRHRHRGRSPMARACGPAPLGGGLWAGSAKPQVAASSSRGAGWQREVKEALTPPGRTGAGGEMRTSLGICGGTVGRA